MIGKDLREQFKTLFDKEDITCVATVFLMDNGNIGVVSMGPGGMDVRMLMISGLKSLDKQEAPEREIVAEEKRVLN